MLVEEPDVGVATEKPKQFEDDGLEVELLGGQEREPIGQWETSLRAEHSQRPSASAVAPRFALLQDEA
jgi:hypothetical protein